MLSDLLFEISLLKCPNLNQKTIKSLKTFVISALATAESQAQMHPQYFENYRRLVACMTHLQEHRKPENVFVATKPAQKRKTIKRRLKRNLVHGNEVVVYSTHEQRDSDFNADVQDNFKGFFDSMLNNVGSCPMEFFPSQKFIATAISQVLEFVRLNPDSRLANEKYFVKQSLIDEINKCVVV